MHHPLRSTSFSPSNHPVYGGVRRWLGFALIIVLPAAGAEPPPEDTAGGQALAIAATAVALHPPPPEAPWHSGARHGGFYMYNYYLPPSPSSTPWAPAFSPDGTKIAVGMSGSIWSVAVESGVATELSRGDRYHSSPDWSPDGQWIVYTSDGAGTVGLELLNVETGETLPLTDDEWVYADPVFSPDGTRLAYVSSKPNGYECLSN